MSVWSVARALVVTLGLAAAGPAAGAPAAARLPVDLELVLAVDVSGSVDDVEAKLQREGYVTALLDRDVIAAVRGGMLGRIAVSYVEWADYHRQAVVVPWRLVEDEASAAALSAAIADAPFSRGRFTSISTAIEFAIPLFERNGFEGTRRVIDISGDGPNNNGRLVTLARDEAVAKGITINGLPIVNDRTERFGQPMPDLDLYYETCVIGGPGAFIVVAEDFKSFAVAIRRKMILEIAGRAPAARNAAAPAPLLFRRVAGRAAGRIAPPCDAGEMRLRQRFLDQF